jgi:hypothetical protein
MSTTRHLSYMAIYRITLLHITVLRLCHSEIFNDEYRCTNKCEKVPNLQVSGIHASKCKTISNLQMKAI